MELASRRFLCFSHIPLPDRSTIASWLFEQSGSILTVESSTQTTVEDAIAVDVGLPVVDET